MSRPEAVLVLNAGSSTLKASLVEPGRETALASTTVDWMGEPVEAAGPTLEHALAGIGVGERPLIGVGHRVVHGGPDHTGPVRLDGRTRAALRELVRLAPLHLPQALAVIDAAVARLPDVPHVAAFDTSFHATLPEVVRRYPIPTPWLTDHGIRRYGFHGLSVEWAVERTAALLGRPVADLRLVVAHLGAGSSVTAVDGGRSVDTSMGYTPLEGLMMATRSGSIDPGVPIALLRERIVTLEALDDALQHRSGLLAVGGTSDMRELLARRAAGDPEADLAIAMFEDRAAAAIGAAATRLPALDGLVFTGGIGEAAAEIRSAIVGRLAVLGFGAPARAAAGQDVQEDALLTDRGPGGGTPSAPAVVRVKAREDLVIARAVLERSVG